MSTRETNTKLPALLALGAVAFVLLTLWVVRVNDVNHDEVEHLAVAFRILQGEIPYTDFHQNHFPGLWYLLAPALQLMKPGLAPLYFGRLLNVAVLGFAALLGVRLLRQVQDESKLTPALFLIFLFALNPEFEFYRLRPDGLMCLPVFIAFYLMTGRSVWSRTRAFSIGLLFGLSLFFSIKALFLVPTVFFVLFVFRPELSLRSKAELLGYCALGGIVGLLPLVGYFLVLGNFSPFFDQVLLVNRDISKPFERSLRFLSGLSWPIISLAFVLLFFERNNLDKQQRLLFFTSAVWVLLSYLILFITCHGSVYNAQLLIFPAALVAAFTSSRLLRSIVQPRVRSFVAVWLLLWFSVSTVSMTLTSELPGSHVSLWAFRRVVSLVGHAAPKCIGFAPVHPVYCSNVSSLMLDWDLLFYRKLKHTRWEPTFREYWREGLEKALSGEVDVLVVKYLDKDVWKRAVELGALDEDDLQKFRALRPQYESVQIGTTEVWVRASAFRKNRRT